MRKHQQNQIFELIKTLNEVCAEIKRLMSRQDFDSVIRLLSDSQEFALQIGNYIESIEGEGTQTVTLLEEYYEILYKISVDLIGGSEGGSFISGLRKQLTAIENSIKTELKPNKIEVVFFPYKASMWDALESVWLAAKDDPQCEAHVVPIPYYDKKPDSTFGRMHYEGDLYPDYVPVEDWRSYNLDERRPDAVFIHNPYDERNTVTSVHPQYYSSRLRGLTDLLVYIPYFVASGDISKHFCTTAACIYAHRVILQSDKVRDFYVSVFKETFGKKFGRPEDKFLALGSPKFDKVISSKPEDFTLPEEWARLIEQPDGTRKKNIFYNTSVGAMLTGNEQYLKKLRSVFKTFRERDDVVLWWRPHPLSETTYQSMRPQLLDEYRLLVDEYKRDGFGIYDDTPDLNRAIAVSDGYYGDLSSLIEMYKAIEKPVEVQHAAQIALRFEGICDGGDCFWGASTNYNGIFKIDKLNFSAKLVAIIDGENPSPYRLYCNIVFAEGKLFLVPFGGNFFVVFDTATDELFQIPVKTPENENNYEPIRKFNSAYEYEGSMIFIGDSYPGLVRINIETLNAEYFEDCFTPNTGEHHFRKGFYENGKLFAVHKSSDSIAIIDLKTMQCSFSPITKFDKKAIYNELHKSNGYYYIAEVFGDSILRINVNNLDDVKPISTSKYKKNGIQNYITASSDTHIFFLPIYGNDRALKIDISTDDLSIAKEFDTEFSAILETIINKSDNFVGLQYLSAFCSADCIYTFEHATCQLMVYNYIDETFKFKKIFLDENDVIPTYIKAIKRADSKSSNTNDNFEVCGNGTAGQKIYDYGKKAVLGT